MEQLTLLSPERLAGTSASPESAPEWPGRAADWPLFLRRFYQSCVRAGSSGKMCPEFFPQTEDGTSGHSSGHWTTSGIHARGECLTLNFSECPRDAAECSLSDILETGDLPQRYFLSAKACAGILRRAEKRRKTLPEPLRRALEEVSERERQYPHSSDPIGTEAHTPVSMQEKRAAESA